MLFLVSHFDQKMHRVFTVDALECLKYIFPIFRDYGLNSIQVFFFVVFFFFFNIKVICKPSQNFGELPKYLPNLKAVSAVTLLRPLIISLILV